MKTIEKDRKELNGSVKQLAPGIASALSSAGVIKQVPVIAITPEMAEELLKDNSYEGQRSLREGRVQQYAEAMIRGEFLPSPIDVARLDGRRYLINGQHRLHAILRAGVPVEQLLNEYDAPSMEAIHTAYQRTDVGAHRSMRDIIQTMSELRELGLKTTETALIGTAAIHILAGFRGSSIGAPLLPYHRSEAMRLKGISHWAEEAVAFYEAVKANGHIFRNGAVLAVGLVTFRHQEARAVNFWRQVAENDRLSPRTGQWHLLRTLQARQKGQFPNAYSKRVASCWNAYYSGLEIKAPLVRSADAPIEIKGTPYKGNSLPEVNYE